jgi:hypothetical protein
MGLVIALTPSMLSSFEYWRSIEDENRAAAVHHELTRHIQGIKDPPSDALALGSAWHEAIGQDVIGIDVVNVEATPGIHHSFHADSVLHVRQGLPGGVLFEVPGRLELPEIDAVVRCRADAIGGLVVHEFKSTQGQIKYDNYEKSAQWRCYLLAFECTACTYHISALSRDKKTGQYYARQHAQLQMFTYADIRRDVVARMAELRQFIVDQGLEEHRTLTGGKMNA